MVVVVRCWEEVGELVSCDQAQANEDAYINPLLVVVSNSLPNPFLGVLHDHAFWRQDILSNCP